MNPFKLYCLRDLHRQIFGNNSNYNRLSPIKEKLKQDSLDYAMDNHLIRDLFNKKGLDDPCQKGFSEYQCLAILKALAELSNDNSASAIARLLTGQNPVRIVKERVKMLNGEDFSQEAVLNWATKQTFNSEQLTLPNRIIGRL